MKTILKKITDILNIYRKQLMNRNTRIRRNEINKRIVATKKTEGKQEPAKSLASNSMKIKTETLNMPTKD